MFSFPRRPRVFVHVGLPAGIEIEIEAGHDSPMVWALDIMYERDEQVLRQGVYTFDTNSVFPISFPN